MPRLLLLTAIALASACRGGERGPEPYTRPSATGKKHVVHVTLEGLVPERSQPGLLGQASVRSLYEWTRLLDAIRRDGDVAALFLEVRTVETGWATTDELAAAFEALRRSGRKVHCAIEDVDDREYVFALRACDTLGMEPTATLWLDGLAMHQMFLRETLASIGLEADVVQIGRYKGTGEMFARDAMSDELRSVLTDLVDRRFAGIVDGIAVARRKAADAVRALIDRGPFTAREAHAAGLIDRVASFDQVRYTARKEAGGRVIRDYDRTMRERTSSDELGELFRALVGMPGRVRLQEPSLVVLYAVGAISRSGDGVGSAFGEEAVTADEMVPLIEDLGRDEQVKAVVVRIDSPGGSPLASDLIWRALRRLDRKKPVVASMGDVAASGGYYIAVGARRILADASTITGSIGVVGGKLATKGLRERIHLHEETLQRGRHAAMLSSSDRFTDSERERIVALMTDTYEQFVARVATGRKMQRAAVYNVAEGRIWTGARAKEVGLVDDLGTLDDAIAFARRAGGLREGAPVVRLPAAGGLFDLLRSGVVAAGTDVLGGAGPLAMAQRTLSPTLRRFTAAALRLEEEPVLTLLPFTLETR